MTLDIVPPAEGTDLPEVTPEQRAENNRRMAQEDSIRNAYVATFVTEEQGVAFARKYAMDAESVSRLLVASRGNHQTLTDFLSVAAKEKNAELALSLLRLVSDKDLRDVTPEVLEDHFRHSVAGYCGEYYYSSILNPRIANEMLTPYKEFFQKAVSANEVAVFHNKLMQILHLWKSRRSYP